MYICIDIYKLMVACPHLNYSGGLGIQVPKLNFYFFIADQVRPALCGLGLAV
jgi:hypothetical protein